MKSASPAAPSALGEGRGEGSGRGEGRALERLKWRSRRGLLELDLVFERYWAGPGREMNESQAAALERLLAMPDNDLLDLVMGRTRASDAALRGLVEKLRAA